MGEGRFFNCLDNLVTNRCFGIRNTTLEVLNVRN